jgi:hypothetical protein
MGSENKERRSKWREGKKTDVNKLRQKKRDRTEGGHRKIKFGGNINMTIDIFLEVNIAAFWDMVPCRLVRRCVSNRFCELQTVL